MCPGKTIFKLTVARISSTQALERGWLFEPTLLRQVFDRVRE